MKKKRKLTDIITTIGVGVTTTIGGVELIKTAVDIGNGVVPYIEKYVGLVGSGAVQYGLPVMAGIGVLSFICKATKATDNYLLGLQKA